MSIKIDPDTQTAVDPENIKTLTVQNVMGALIAVVAFVITWKVIL